MMMLSHGGVGYDEGRVVSVMQNGADKVVHICSTINFNFAYFGGRRDQWREDYETSITEQTGAHM